MKTAQPLENPLLFQRQNLGSYLSGPSPDVSIKEATYPAYLEDTLSHAELLLKYAAENGIHIEPGICNHVLNARTVVSSKAWDNGTAAALLTALTQLTERVEPVTWESLECSKEYGFRSLWTSGFPVVLLALVIGAFSVATFVASGLSTAVNTDIRTANDLAVKLRVQLGPWPGDASIHGTSPKTASGTSAQSQSKAPPGIDTFDVITELQQLASTIRAIDGRAQQLNKLVFLLPEPNRAGDPFADVRKNPSKILETLELPPGLSDLPEAARDRIKIYQEVRYFAQQVLDEVSLGYGAITACILPVLYALLGACAYLFRSFKRHIRNKTYIPSYSNFARFIIAAIGGAVVGLFNNFSVTQGATISPLALAFLVGYAVDVFYAFLDGLLHQFKNTPASPSPKNTRTPPITLPTGKKPNLAS